MKYKLPRTFYNWISLMGVTIALISLFMIIFLFVVSTFFAPQEYTYLGLVIYILLPGFLILGLILIPIGMFIQSKRKRKPQEKKWPEINLNDTRQRNAFLIFGIGTAVFLLLSAVGSYEAFHYTESVEFCGETCHEVMHPEFTAYNTSPHARVKCVDCHVGTGADWYVRSKLSGLYQVYSVLFDKYPKPIPTPIENLRPARETCEQCHWPQKFYARKLRYDKHYLSDENNTEWDIGLTMKIGSKHSALGLEEGIHWHINPDVRVEYASLDHELQEIVWIKYSNLKTGEEHIYTESGEPIEEAQLDTLVTQVMDCMDCHNRPSHSYKPPAFFVDNAITAGSIPKTLPEIKSVTMDISGEEYSTMDSAMLNIENEMNSFYEENYPELYDTNRQLIEQGIAGFKAAYSENIFPDMKVRWSAYPNNIGHLEFDGCFRCHNDTHESQDGRTIAKDCQICHEINAQGNPDNLQVANVDSSLTFEHPVDIGGAWEEFLCTDCHTGLNP